MMDDQSPIDLISGYYLKARDMRHHYIGKCPPCVRETYDLLLEQANHQDRISSGRTIKRGQTFRTYGDIKEALAWNEGWKKCTYSTGQIETALKILRRTGLITIRRTTRGMLITLVNYDYYQDPKSYRNQSTSQATDHSDNNTRTTPEPDDKQSINEFLLNKEKQKGGADPLPSGEEGAGAPEEREAPPAKLKSKAKRVLPFSQKWQDFIEQLSEKDIALHTMLAGLKSIDDRPGGNTVMTGDPFTVQHMDRRLREIEKAAGEYFHEPVVISFKVWVPAPR